MTCAYLGSFDHMRITKVDSCGKPVPGPNAFETDCVVSVAATNVTQDQDDRVYTADNGSVCAIKRGCRTLLGYDLEVTSLPLSPEMVEIMTGNAGYLDAAGKLIGNDSCANIPCKEGFALELWASLIGEDACTTTGKEQYLYVLFPWVTNGLLSDITIGGDVFNPVFTGSTRAGGQWGTGPWDVQNSATNVPGPMLTPLGNTCHRRMFITDVPPAAASCDFVTVPTP